MWGNTKCICKREKNNAHEQKLRLHNFDPCAPVDFFAPPSPYGQLQIIEHSPLLPLGPLISHFFFQQWMGLRVEDWNYRENL